MEEGFIKNMLTGIRQWVNAKIADINTAIEGKQDVLTAGENIEITSGGTISVTGVTSATEQALEDMSLVISSNINELDGRLTTVENGKQDALTAGDNIEIDSAGTISVTGFADWAKQPNKPTYTAQEVGAMPEDTVIIDDSEVTSGTTFSSSKIVDLLNGISQFTVRIVQTLPASGETHVIYFVPAVASGETSGSDVMDEYMWIEGKWEMIGSTRIDMSDYYTVEETNDLLDAKLDIPDISVQDVLDELNQED